MRSCSQSHRPCLPGQIVTALNIDGVAIEDTFAEAFGMRATRLVITAASPVWARHAAVATTGFATSVIACGCEGGIERTLTPRETPDRRPGMAVLLFAMSSKDLQKQLERRAGQCVLTCPTTAAYGGIPAEAASILVGYARVHNDKHYWHDILGSAVIAHISAFFIAKPYSRVHVSLIADPASNDYYLAASMRF